MGRLMVSISGIRGVVGEELTPDVIRRYSIAFGRYLAGKPVVVGGDSRTSGLLIRNLLKGCLQACGCQVIDIGIVPTPTVQMAIIHHKSAGGVAVTASHNPAEWNGLKFMDADGRFLSPEKAEKVYAMAMDEESGLSKWESVGMEVTDDKANQRHVQEILSLPYVEAGQLRKRKFNVVVDCVNGAGGLIIPHLLDHLGCSTTVIHGEANGRFAHTPEPLPENLGDLIHAVKKEKADIGFAVDPDVDRCALVDNTGTPAGEEYTLAAAIKFILGKKLGPVVVNMSTSRACEDIARYYNCPFYRSKVGEINVAEEMIARGAVIGGEGNGGVMLPELHVGRDAPLAVALILQFLLEAGIPMDQLLKSLPQYKIVKSKMEIGTADPDQILEKMAERHKDKKTDNLDGLKIDDENYWVHLRKSNTEPVVRVMGEARDEKTAGAIVDQYMAEIRDLMK